MKETTAGEVECSPMRYTVTHAHDHKTLQLGDVVVMAEAPNTNKDFYLIRTSDMTLHTLVGDNDQWVHLGYEDAVTEVKDASTLQSSEAPTIRSEREYKAECVRVSLNGADAYTRGKGIGDGPIFPDYLAKAWQDGWLKAQRVHLKKHGITP